MADFTTIANLRGPAGRDGSNVLPTDEAMAQTAADPQSEFATQLSATIGEVAAEQAGNPETALYGAILEVAGSITPSGFPLFFYPETLNDPRPVTERPVWWIITSDDPDAYPVNLINGDTRIVRKATPLPFSPLDIPGVAAYFDATTLSLADGSAVQTWPNMVSGGPSAVRFDGATAPVLDLDGLNGHPTVVFNGTNGVLLADGFPNYTGIVTVFVVARSTPTTTAGTDFIYDGGNATTPTQQLGLSRNASNQWRVDRSSNFLVAGADSAAHLFKVVYDTSASSLQVDAGAATVGTTGANIGMTKLTIGGRGDGASANTHVGGISALVLVRGAVSAQDESDLRALLNARFGI